MANKNMGVPHRSRGQLGSYDLLRTLGIGGFGKVYLGEHIHLHTEAAVKVLHAALVSEQAQKFKHEAQTVAQLVPHPHIVRVLDYNIEGDRPYIVMDYAPNGNLRQRHTFGEKVPLPKVVSYVKQLAFGLQHAHNSGVVHCDVKPENMFLGNQGQVLIGDFGIAVGIQEENPQSEDTFGTVPYMAPEQICGQPEPASDQYALAVVAYEWLTGQLPFSGSDKLEIVMNHLYNQPLPISIIDPTIPVRIEQVLMKALDKDPLQRYPSIAAFAQALENASGLRRPTTIRQEQASAVVNNYVRHPARTQRSVRLQILLLLLIPLAFLSFLAYAFWLFPVASVTITETGLTQTWAYHVLSTIESKTSLQNPAAAHFETIITASQSNKVPTTGNQHIQATQAHGEVTFYNSDIIVHIVPAGTTITIPNSTLQVKTDETVTIPAGDLSEAGQVNVPAYVVQAGSDGNIAAHALFGITCCSSDNIRVDNLNTFSGGQDDHVYSIVQQSDIHDAARPLEASQMLNSPTLLQNQAQPHEVLVSSSVQCVPTVSSDSAVGSRATAVSVTVTSTCKGVFYNIATLSSFVRSQFIDYEDHMLGSTYALRSSIRMNVIKNVLLPPKDGLTRLILDVLATGVWHFNFNEMRKRQLLQAIAGQDRSKANIKLIQIIHKPGVNTIDIQFAWNIPLFANDRLPSDINRIRFQIVQK